MLAGAVLADVGLVWQNCRTFNAEGSDITAMADEAEAHFVQLWAKKELPFESADVLGRVAEPRKHASLQTLTGAALGKGLCSLTGHQGCAESMRQQRSQSYLCDLMLLHLLLMTSQGL